MRRLHLFLPVWIAHDESTKIKRITNWYQSEWSHRSDDITLLY